MAASTAVPFPRFYSLPFLMNNHNRSIIHRQLYFRPPPLYGILRLHHHLQLLLLLLLSAVTPYTTAQSSTGPSQNPYGDYNSVSQPLAIIVVVFVCAIFLMGFFSIYIRRCTDDTSSAEISRRFYAYATPAASRGCPRRTPCGLDPSVIESFPIFVYSAVKHLKIGKEALQCAVCITEFEDNETLRLLPKCNHVFHSECIDVWLVSHLTCPVCRAYLEPSPGTQFTGSPEEEIPIPELSELVQDHVSITVQENQTRDSQVIMINEIVNTSKFPRSHSTGHSLVQPGESSERYTLRLPDEVRTQIVVNQRLKQTSSVRGYRSGTGEESSNFSSFFSSFSTANVKTNK